MDIQKRVGAQQVGFERVAPYKFSRNRNSLPEIHETGRVDVTHCVAATDDGKPVQGQAIKTNYKSSLYIAVSFQLSLILRNSKA